jgi:hypothetical protein
MGEGTSPFRNSEVEKDLLGGGSPQVLFRVLCI